MRLLCAIGLVVVALLLTLASPALAGPMRLLILSVVHSM